MKKVLALALAIVMVFTLSISAFAAPASTATIKVYVEDSLEATETVTVAVGMTVKDALDAKADTLYPEWKVVANNNPNISATTAYALESFYGAGTLPLGEDSGIPAQYWSTQNPGYGLESMTVDGDTTTYHYIYVGYDWVYTVNGETPVDSVNGMELYMDQCYITAGDTIELNYDLQIVRWDSTQYIFHE